MNFAKTNSSKPEACQKVAGGRSAAKTSGQASPNFRIPEGCQTAGLLETFLASLQDAISLRRFPGVSLRSTPGYHLATFQIAEKYSCGIFNSRDGGFLSRPSACFAGAIN